MDKFLIYSKVGCTYCDKIVNIMNSNGIEYTKLTLGEDYTRDEFLEKFGKTTFPRVVHEGKVIGGMKETAMYLIENKYV